jgi:hypothetical protein
MNVYEFKSTVVCSEIDLNEMATHFGINKKFKWVEPLVLTEENLKGIIPQPQDKIIYIYHFGSNNTYSAMR